MKKPVLFLDIDGVLNHNQRYTVYDYPRLFPEHCKLLEAICAAVPDLGIVITSNWKGILAIDRVIKYLVDAVPGCQVIDATPFGPSRGDEVAGWRLAHQHEGAYAILDDRGDYREGQNLVQTADAVGLTAGHASQVIDLLKGDQP